MSFEVEDKVRVIGLENTANMVLVGLDPEGCMEELCLEQAVGVVTRIDGSNGINGAVGVQFDKSSGFFWFAIADLEEAVSLDEIEADVEPLKLPLVSEIESLDDVEVGDLVRLKDQDSYPERVANCTSFEQLGLDRTATFEVEELDFSDGSLYIKDENGSDGYVYTKDLVLLDEICAGETPQEFEDEAIDAATDELAVTWNITNDSVTLSMNGTTDVATVGTANFMEIRQAVLDGEYKQAHGLMNIAVGITQWGNGSLQIDSGEVRYNGMSLTGKLVDRVIDMMADGDEGFKSFANFLNKVLEHESFTTRSRLMDFAAHDKLDLTEDGDVVAFKNVRSDYFDKHSGTFDNHVGNTLSMRRADVDDNHDRACSTGLHVCSPTYLKGFWGTSGKTMRVIVKPKNFVAVPYDYKDSKARVCEYTVVEDVTDNIADYL